MAILKWMCTGLSFCTEPGRPSSLRALSAPITSTSSRPQGDDDLEGYHKRCRPHHVHLSLHQDPEKITIMWMTTHHGCESRVLYRSSEHVGTGQEEFEASLAKFLPSPNGDVDTLDPDDMCAKPAIDADFDTSWHHRVTLEGLEPGMRYWYCVEAASYCAAFVAPPSQASHASFSLVHYGDMGVDDDPSAKAMGAGAMVGAVSDAVLDGGVDLVLHMGDVSYADGRGDIWSRFMTAISQFAQHVPYMVAVGNHDYDYRGSAKHDPSGTPHPFRPHWGDFQHDSGGECAVPLFKRFTMPGGDSSDLYRPSLGNSTTGQPTAPVQRSHHPRSPDADNPPFWYSYDYGSAHFVILSSEHSLEPHGVQWEWLVRHLARVDRCRTPWLILGIHRPLYVVHPHHTNRKIAKHLRRNIEDVLVKYGVDLVLSGHVHSYSRTCPVIDRRCVAHERGGILHAVAGSGGRKLSRISRKQKDWVAYAERTFGYVLVEVEDASDGSSSLDLSFVDAESRDTRDRVRLHSTLRRDGVCAYCYSRTGGFVVGSSSQLGSCGAPLSTSDLDQLFAERLARDARDMSDDEDDPAGELSPALMAAAGVEMDLESEDLPPGGLFASSRYTVTVYRKAVYQRANLLFSGLERLWAMLKGRGFRLTYGLEQSWSSLRNRLM